MVLIVVHDDQTIGRGGEFAKIEVFVRNRNVHIELQTSSMKILAEFRNQSPKPGLSLERNLLEINGCAFVVVCCQESQELGARVFARHGILNKVPAIREPLTAVPI